MRAYNVYISYTFYFYRYICMIQTIIIILAFYLFYILSLPTPIYPFFSYLPFRPYFYPYNIPFVPTATVRFLCYYNCTRQYVILLTYSMMYTGGHGVSTFLCCNQEFTCCKPGRNPDEYVLV